MSSNRLIYDKCAYATEIKESTRPLEYFLFKGKYENGEKCSISEFPNILEFGNRADVENELYGLNRVGTLCPSLKYNPTNNYKGYNYSPPRMCESIYKITPNNLEKPTTNMLKSINTQIN